MKTSDQIRDEKLQYDINREVAKISALSSGKIHKYEYLTGEDILPTNQQQITEQTKFTYSPLGKDFGKQIKTIEDQGQKQVESLESLKTNEQAKAITYDDDDDDDDDASLEQKEKCHNKLFDKKLDEIQELSRKIDYKNLNYIFTTKDSGSVNFIKSKGPVSLSKKITDGDMSLMVEMVEEDLEKFKREFNQIKLGNPEHKSGYIRMQLYTI